MIQIRRWTEVDAPSVRDLDVAFTTDVIYHVTADEACFCLREMSLSAPLTKSYPMPAHPERADDAFVAEVEARIIGYAELVYEPWSRRGNVRHLYVAQEARTQHVGTALLAALEESARNHGARMLWIETQNVNYPAIQFYRRRGFELVGLDRSLYGPISDAGEVALFFSRALS